MNVWDALMRRRALTSRTRTAILAHVHARGRTGVAQVQPGPPPSPVVIGGGRAEAATGFTPTGGGGMVTGIMVSYNTRLLVEVAYQSIRKFYPDMPVIIVDGSDPDNSTAAYVKSLASPLTTVVSFGRNVFHGPGMNIGINYCQTPYALLVDTDAELLEPCVGDMLAMMEEDTFGVGYVIPTAFSGFGTIYSYPPEPTPQDGNWMPYLHPYFQLIDIRNYRKFPPYVHGGAPCTPTMLAIYRRGLAWKIIKQFKDMANGTPKYVKHDGGGTCRRDPKACT
jgi:glycosyltransferase involved in cell wall biosynthesis